MTEPTSEEENPTPFKLNWSSESQGITLGNVQLPFPTGHEYPTQVDQPLHRRQLSGKVLATRHKLHTHIYTKRSPTGQDFLAERKLREAANQSDIDALVQLVTQGVNPCSADSKSRTALHFAATQGNEHIIRVLLDRGANPNAKDLNGNTPLHLAACTNQVKIVTLLLRAGTDINAVDCTGRTPLDVACSRLRILQGDINVRSAPLKYREEVLLIIDMLNEYLSRTGMTKEQQQLSEISDKIDSVATLQQVGVRERGNPRKCSGFSVKTFLNDL